MDGDLRGIGPRAPGTSLWGVKLLAMLAVRNSPSSVASRGESHRIR